jgi:F0F1-type ATP synthase membrane subunit c/vacuolar-type H+-ATPase subunit K
MAQDLEYSVGINTKKAQQSLTGLKTQIAGIGAALGAAFTVSQLIDVTARFEKLRTTLGLVCCC